MSTQINALAFRITIILANCRSSYTHSTAGANSGDIESENMYEDGTLRVESEANPEKGERLTNKDQVKNTKINQMQ